MDYILNFLEKICNEAPNEVEFSIQKINFLFKKVNENNINSAVICYDGISSEKQKIKFEFCRAYIPGGSFNRIDLKTPGRSGQITSFNFEKLGFVRGEPIIDITQTIRLSGRDKEANKIKKELAINLLSSEGLLYSQKDNRWYLGTYNNQQQEWLYGRDTERFISDFLRLGVIMAYVRGDDGIKLQLTKTR